MNKVRRGITAFQHIDSLLISIAGFYLIHLYTRYGGIGVSPDSIAYLSVARNIIAHGSAVDYTLRPLVDFPVCYPFFLSAAGFIARMDPLLIAPWVNGLLFAIIIMLLGYLIETFEGVTRWYKNLVLIFIALSPSLVEIYSMLWSETLFLLWSVLFFTAYAFYLKKRSLAALIGWGLIASVACITRYAGVTLIGTGLVLLLCDRSLPLRKRLYGSFTFGLAAGSLLLINLVHNALLTHSLTGPRQAGILTLSDNMVFAGRVICDWLPVTAEHPRLVSGILILIFIIIALRFMKRSWFGPPAQDTENSFSAFFIVYTVFIIGISTLSHFEQINNRFLSPLFIPMVLSLTSWIPRSLAGWQSATSRLAAGAGLVLCLIFGFYEYQQVHLMYEDVKDSGIPGYTEDGWKKSETAAFLRQEQKYFNKDYDIYSNAHEAAYFNGNVIAESIPHRIDQIDTRDFFSEDGFYLIWFDNFSDNELIKFRTIWKNSEMVKLKDFKDGDIFFVRPHTNAAITGKH